MATFILLKPVIVAVFAHELAASKDLIASGQSPRAPDVPSAAAAKVPAD